MNLVTTWIRRACVLVLLALGARAQGADDAAVQAFRAGDLATASAEWSARLADRSLPANERARLCFNLGNAAFRAEKPLEAVAWYEASLRLRPRDADTWANVEHARVAAGLEPKDRGDLAATTQRVLFALTLAEAQWLALAGVVLGAAALAFEALRGGRAGRRIAWLGFVFVLASSGPWIARKVATEHEPHLVVETGHALVRSEPRKDAAVVAEAPAGSVVERRDELLDWLKIELASGASGWVPRSQVFALER